MRVVFLAITSLLFWSIAVAPASAYDLIAWFKALVNGEIQQLHTPPESYEVEELFAGLESPWALEFAPDGRLFITERSGRLRIARNGRLLPAPVRGVPEVAFVGQGGLLDIALHPDFSENHWLYLAYTVPDNISAHTRVARFRETSAGLTEKTIIFPGVPGSTKNKHFGCRLAFGKKGRLYITLGERGEGHRAQDLQDLNGKTLRLNDDGTIPSDNPFVGREDARPEIFSYGHRNAQGMAIQPGTGLIFQTEHGPSWNDAPGGGDEINIVESGQNYGWPEIHHRETAPHMVAPLVEYTPAMAPSGAAFYTGAAFPSWQNDFFFAGLVGKSLVRIKLDGRKVRGQEILLNERFGRLRDVECGPDGLLYVLTSQTDAYGPGRAEGDRLLRLIPVGGAP